MSAEHTPTPWSLGGEHLRTLIRGADATIVAVRHRHDAKTHVANAAFIVRAVNCHADLVAALDKIFSRISYVNIHGVGEQPEPTGDPQPVRVSKEEFWRLFQEIGTVAAAALAKAEAQS